jgi:hypothetical protein
MCNRYYRLTELLAKQQKRLVKLLDNAPLYCGQTSLAEIDAIIRYYREAQAANADVEKTGSDLKETARNIMLVMQHFGIPPGTALTGEIANEITYEVWLDEEDNDVDIIKTKDLAPEADNPNVIIIIPSQLRELREKEREKDSKV